MDSFGSTVGTIPVVNVNLINIFNKEIFFYLCQEKNKIKLMGTSILFSGYLPSGNMTLRSTSDPCLATIPNRQCLRKIKLRITKPLSLLKQDSSVL